jgi:hypothetical protein
LFRKKSWDDAVVSRSWLREGRILMLRAVPDFPENLRDISPEYPDAVRFWEPKSINATGLAFAFWRRMFLERPLSTQPPTWDELLAQPRPARSSFGRSVQICAGAAPFARAEAG